MDTYNVLSFDEVTGMDGGKDAKARPKLKRDVKRIEAPCNTCPCEFICAGSLKPGSAPNWKRAMSCSIFKQFTIPVKGDRPKVDRPDRLPSRELYLEMFG